MGGGIFRRYGMFSYLWPIGLVLLSNTLYQICAKSTPVSLNPFASLTITYLVGAAVSTVIFFITSGGGNLLGGLGDVMADLTGIGAQNTDASETAQKTGKEKSSGSGKKGFPPKNRSEMPFHISIQPLKESTSVPSISKIAPCMFILFVLFFLLSL